MFRSLSNIFSRFRVYNYTKAFKPVSTVFNQINRPKNMFLPFLPTTNQQKHRISFENYNTLLALSILGWLGFVDEDENKESELIMTLKRSVLASRREQYDKAEQLLHIALRLAQQQQNEQGVVYCYDLMANVAFDRLQLAKAEKLFVSVLQMLLSSGTKQDDLKVCPHTITY